MKMHQLYAAAIAVTIASSSAFAVVLFDANGFEAPTYVAGPLNGQNGWVYDNPAAQVFTVTPTATPDGQVVVANGGVASNWAFPPLNYTPPSGTGVSVITDIARTVGATAATTSSAYTVDMYQGASQITRYGLLANGTNIQAFITTRFNSTTGDFDPAGPVANVLITNPLPASTFFRFESRLNFTTKSLELLINGQSIDANIPFALLTATTLGDVDLNVLSGAGRLDTGSFDNYLVQTFVIPEPATLSAVAGLSVLGLRRRRA